MQRWILSSAVVCLISAALIAQAPQTVPPTFKAGVEYVEIDARVLDAHGNAVRNLAKDDFQVLEDGVPQPVAVFASVDIPLPPGAELATAAAATVPPVPSDVASNARPQTDGRIYLIVFDDRFITPSGTPEVRKVMRQFVDRYIGPDDLVGIVTLGFSRAFQGFTNDRRLLVAAIDSSIGAKRLSPTIDNLTSIENKAAMSPINGTDPAPLPPAAVDDKQIGQSRESQRQLVELARAMSAMGARSKAIVLVSEGTLAPTINNLETLALNDDLRSASGIDRQTNIPVYPIDPRGLTDGSNDTIEVGAVTGSVEPTVNLGMKQEILSSKAALLRIAEDTGGAASLGNDFRGAFDRIVHRSSSYYVLGYNSTNARRDGRFRSIQVKVKRPGLTVVTRSGYTAASSRAPEKPSYPGPSGTSEGIRQALNSGLPMSGLVFATTAAAFRDKGSEASVAVVLESPAASLALTERNNAFAGSLEVLVAALDFRGSIKSSDTKQIQINFTPEIHNRVNASGFRWLSRLSIKPGRYQLRVAAVSGPEKRGSVWLDLEVPDFSAGDLTMSGVMLASAAAFQTPTFKPDKQLDAILPGPPTAARRFPSGDQLTAFAEIYANKASDPRQLDVTISVRNAQGMERFKTTETDTSEKLKAANGVHRIVSPIQLNLLPGEYVLTIGAQRRGDTKVVSRSVPFRVG